MLSFSQKYKKTDAIDEFLSDRYLFFLILGIKIKPCSKKRILKIRKENIEKYKKGLL